MYSDLESYLRKQLREGSAEITHHVWLNDEGRVVLSPVQVTKGDEAPIEFVVFGHQTAIYNEKPPTQRATIEGFDAHRGMGDRS